MNKNRFMPFWSSQKIESKQGELSLIDPFKNDRINQGSYELTLSREVAVTPDGEPPRHQPGKGPALFIPPGQFALLLSRERVSVPDDVIAFISIKSSIKLKGLVNVSGFHVDPGFEGRLKFSVYNAGNRSIVLTYFEPCFLIWFADLDQSTRDPYRGKNRNQSRLSNGDREQMMEENHSPASLHHRLQQLEQVVRVTKTIATTLFVTVILGVLVTLLANLIWHFIEPKKEESRSSQQQTNNTPPSRDGGKHQP